MEHSGVDTGSLYGGVFAGIIVLAFVIIIVALIIRLVLFHVCRALPSGVSFCSVDLGVGVVVVGGLKDRRVVFTV